MSSVINDIKNKLKPNSDASDTSGGSNEAAEEQQFSIQPHPAVRSISPPTTHVLMAFIQKTNNPADLAPQPGAGITSKPEFEAFHTPGPYVPSAATANSVEPPKVSMLAFNCWPARTKSSLIRAARN